MSKTSQIVTNYFGADSNPKDEADVGLSADFEVIENSDLLQPQQINRKQSSFGSVLEQIPTQLP